MTGKPTLGDLGLRPMAEDGISSAHAARVAHTLDLDESVLVDGMLPLTWIWTYFTPTTPTATLRADGHPAGSDSGPLAGLDRRMFVGGSLERRGEIRLEERTERTSAVLGAQRKEGRTGQFLIVDVEHEYRQRGDIVLVERQQLLYRAPPEIPVPPPGPAVEPPVSTGPRRDLRPDERLLFRYSALTFNSHRIHYDLPYATEVEGYPGLVVHGPLTATVLADLAAEARGGPLTRFEFRATAPTFANTELALVCDDDDADDTDGALSVRAVREDGATVMSARAR